MALLHLLFFFSTCFPPPFFFSSDGEINVRIIHSFLAARTHNCKKQRNKRWLISRSYWLRKSGPSSPHFLSAFVNDFRLAAFASCRILEALREIFPAAMCQLLFFLFLRNGGTSPGPLCHYLTAGNDRSSPRVSSTETMPVKCLVHVSFG